MKKLRHNRSKYNHTPQRRCCICGSEKFLHLFSEKTSLKATLNIVKCASCSLVVTDPQPALSDTEKLYSDSCVEKKSATYDYCFHPGSIIEDHPIVLEHLARLISGRDLLDIGCGTGTFLERAAPCGWNCHGLDPSEYATGIAKKRIGPHIVNSYLSPSVFGDSRFDVLTLWYVLEHTHYPDEILTDCHQLMKPDGILFIAVPNVHYLMLKRNVTKLVTHQPSTFHPQEHLFHFSPKTLMRLLEKTGFQALYQLQAAPFSLDRQKPSLTKRILRVFSQSFFKLTGINFSGILLLARKI